MTPIKEKNLKSNMTSPDNITGINTIKNPKNP